MGFRRGTLTAAHVTGAVRLALDRGASQAAVIATLATCGLSWEAGPDTIRVIAHSDAA